MLASLHRHKHLHSHKMKQHFLVLVFACGLLFVLDTLAFEPPVVVTTTRRQIVWSFLLSGAASIGTLAAVSPPPEVANAVLRSKGCYSGEGEGCSELSENNELIRSLQEKSLANKDRHEKVSI
jgi:hypothetical protein